MKLTEEILSSLADAIRTALDERGDDRARLEQAARWVQYEMNRRALRHEKPVSASMTPQRRDWLTLLAHAGPQCRRKRTVVANDCMMLGWTEWDLKLGDGTAITESTARSLYGEGWLTIVKVNGLERITVAGRDALGKAPG